MYIQTSENLAWLSAHSDYTINPALMKALNHENLVKLPGENVLRALRERIGLCRKLVQEGADSMEMGVNKESVRMEQLLGTCESQAAVEGDVTLPGGLREEARVLHACGMAVVESTECLQDRVSVSGRVIFEVIYTQGAPDRILSIEAAADFTHLCDIDGVQPRTAAFAQARVEHVEAAVNGGRLLMRAVLRIQARAWSYAPVEVITGMEGVQQRQQEITLQRTAASGSSDVLLREEFSLPAELQIRETLYATAFPVLSDVTGGLGRIGMVGQIMLEAVHASSQPGRPLVVTRHSLPVEQSVDMSGENGDLLDGRITVKDVAVASQETGDGERMLRVEVLAGLQGWADRRETVPALMDAYTVSGDDVRLSMKPVQFRTGSNRITAAESGKAMLLLPDSAPPVRTMLAAFVNPVLSGWEQSGGRMMTEGVLQVRLVYMTDDSDAPVSVLKEEPFRLSFAAQAGEEDFIALNASDVDVHPVTSDRVELKYVMHMTLEGSESERTDLAVDAQATAAEPPVEDIVLYFVQPGERLWDIARHYRVPVQGVQELNPGLTGEPKAGQGIVVWRRNAEFA